VSAPSAPAGSPGIGMGLLVVLGILWGSTFPIVRMGIDAGADPFLLVTVDFLLAAALAFLVAAFSRSTRPPVRELGISAGLGALMIGGINIPLFWGMQFATGGAAAIVYATAPAISLLVLFLLHRAARPSALRLGGLALGIAGVLALSLAASSGGPITNDWALVAFGIGAICQGTGAVLLAQYRPHGEGRWGQAAQFSGAAGLGLATLPFLARSFALPASPAVVGSVLYFALVSMVVGYTLYFELVRRTGPVSANLVTFLNPVVALIVGVLAFGETFGTAELVGLALVLVALVLLELPVRHPRPERPGENAGAGLGARPLLRR